MAARLVFVSFVLYAIGVYAQTSLRTEFATDIAAVYPQKRVTLLHSRSRLLPRFDNAMHEEGECCVLLCRTKLRCGAALQGLQELNVRVILGERLDFESLQQTSATKRSSEPRVVRTLSGQEISANLVVSISNVTNVNQ